jgi:hypothetical protein
MLYIHTKGNLHVLTTKMEATYIAEAPATSFLFIRCESKNGIDNIQWYT